MAQVADCNRKSLILTTMQENGTTTAAAGKVSLPSTSTTMPMDQLLALDVNPTVPTRSFLDLLNCCAPKNRKGESTDGPTTQTTVPKNQVEPRKEIEVEEEEKTLDDTLPEDDDKPIDFDLPELEEVESEPKPAKENTIIVSFLKIIYTVFFFNFFGNNEKKAIKSG